IVVGAVALAWLWMMAPRLAVLVALDAPGLLPATGALVGNALAMIAIAYVALAVIDALLRRLDHGRALRMTHAEKQEDDRVGGMDPRWRQARVRAGRAPRFTLLVLGGDDELVAVAVAWDPIHRPIPACTTHGRGVRATQLVALARRQGVPIHRDVALASRIARLGPLAERDWPRLAEIVAAVRRQ
ncbi:MAG: EscU/YscU/HrcU family type III secretion system export apparatus switch protein, partial [Proteobacteria bacterium]|nr:EscU/YscU/HrcU family type III secretion system export apparatus switch protein [Pseudomonadota bacterium]